MNENDYPLTIEILEDRPCGADLKKGQFCKAKYYTKDFFSVFDIELLSGDDGWMVFKTQARVII